MWKRSRLALGKKVRCVWSSKMQPFREKSIRWGLTPTDAYICCLHTWRGPLELRYWVLNKEIHANENVYQLLSICFQRRILKADHAKRNHAHREEIHSVLWKMPTTIRMAKPLPRYSCLRRGVHFCRTVFFSLFSLSLYSVYLSGSVQFQI